MTSPHLKGDQRDDRDEVASPWDDAVFAPWDGRRVPVTLLGGYLGSGKTTVINLLLARTDRPIAVLVNDVGEVNVDAALIARQSSDTIELTDGCVCCSLVNGFVDAFDQLRARPVPPEHVLVELSGVADPARAAPWAETIGFRLDSIVVLVDVDQFLERERDEWVGSAVRDQVVGADVLVLTKLDLATPRQGDAVRTRLAELAPGVPITEVPSPDAAAALLSLGTRRTGGVGDLPAPSLFDAHRTTTIAVPDPVEEATLLATLDALPAGTIRAKGVFRLPDGRRLLVQIVGRRRVVSELPQAEHQPTTPLIVVDPAAQRLVDPERLG